MTRATTTAFATACPLTAIEPDVRLAAFLRSRCPDTDVRTEAFEDCPLGEATFDLGFCATAFHWLDEDRALAKIATALVPGGWATVWHVFGDRSQHDAFHEATAALVGGPRSPSSTDDGLPFALDDRARVAALSRTGAFGDIAHRREPWKLMLTADEVPRLYSTYSNIAARADRAAVLAEWKPSRQDRFRRAGDAQHDDEPVRRPAQVARAGARPIC